MISTAFKMEFSEVELPSTGPYITFVGKICSKLKQDDNDCVFGVDATEYNNFSFTNNFINWKIIKTTKKNQMIYKIRYLKKIL